jgi:hypothetical protein
MVSFQPYSLFRAGLQMPALSVWKSLFKEEALSCTCHSLCLFLFSPGIPSLPFLPLSLSLAPSKMETVA